MNDYKNIFIIGSPRSGTTWLQIMLSSHPAICTSVELTLFDKYVRSWNDYWEHESSNIEQDKWHKGLPFLWSQEEFHTYLDRFIEKVYERVLEAEPQATHILDKNPSYALHTDLIDKFLPQSKFIHVIRDGRDVAASMLAANRDLGFGPASIKNAASMWKRHILAGRRAKVYRNRYFEIRYEDLLNDGEKKLAEVFKFCGLPVKRQEIAAIYNKHEFSKMKAREQTPVSSLKGNKKAYRKGKSGSWYEDLEPLQRYVFNRVAGELLLKLGYAENDWWVSSRFQKIALPTRYAISTRNRVLRGTVKALLGTTIVKYLKLIREKIWHC